MLPRLYDWMVDRPHWNRFRHEQLSGVGGEILEIGVGTGLNLPHYPDRVKRITTVDPNPGMNRRLERRIKQTGIDVERRIVGVEQLPFDDESFDCAVSTLTLCSIRRIEEGLAELFRVLKPGGRFEFLEHGRSPDPVVFRWQKRLNWLQGLIGDGCRLDLDVAAAVRSQPFELVRLDNFYMERTPRTHGYMYRGTVVKAV